MTDINTALSLFAKRIGDLYRDTLLNDGAYASGKLSSFQEEFEFRGTNFIIYFNIEDYWEYLEKGQKPHFPPEQPILNWIRIKKILPRPTSSGRIPTEKQLCYLVRRKIANEGTQPRNLLEKTQNSILFASITNEIMDVFTQKYYEEFEQYMNKIFNLKQ